MPGSFPAVARRLLASLLAELVDKTGRNQHSVYDPAPFAVHRRMPLQPSSEMVCISHTAQRGSFQQSAVFTRAAPPPSGVLGRPASSVQAFRSNMLS